MNKDFSRMYEGQRLDPYVSRSSEDKVRVKLKLFAVYQEVFDTADLDLELLPETTVGEVLESLIKQQPQIEKWRSVTRFGVNLQFVESDTVLQEGDEVVLIPPVSGG